MAKTVSELYKLWRERVTDPDLCAELVSIENDEAAINDRFFKSLAFGTGGLRGVIGAGTNYLNIHTIGLAAQALANWVLGKGGGAVAIGYDSRIKSDLFARTTAAVLAANGVKAYIYKELVPTPLVSYAVRQLKCVSGVVITASHNPSKYNGFKCYGPDGYQMTDDDAHDVERIMSGLDIFDDVKLGDFDALLASGDIEYIDDSVMEGFLAAVRSVSVNPEACAEAGLKVIYTPLCGTGNKPVRAILKMAGVSDVTVVPVQELPDGNFPRCPYPNPEIRQAFDAALELAQTVPADLLLATDPDCDRVGIAVRENGEYVLMSGNEVGAMMLDYLLSQRKAKGTLPENPVAVKTIVTSALAARLAENYGCELRNVLTGFKYIGEIVTELEREGHPERFIMGYEESYGYLSGTHARDKDGVVASMLICEMASFYKLQGKTLLDVMRGLYEKYGWYRHRLLSPEFEGEAGMKHIAAIMDGLRANAPAEIAGAKVIAVCDYQKLVRTDLVSGEQSEIKLPQSNVLEFVLADNSALIARPSGTEPKIKFYLTAAEPSLEKAETRLDELEKAVGELLGK